MTKKKKKRKTQTKQQLFKSLYDCYKGKGVLKPKSLRATAPRIANQRNEIQVPEDHVK